MNTMPSGVKVKSFELNNGSLSLYLVGDYEALDIEGKENVQQEKYDYIRELRHKEEIIHNLEKDIAIYKAQLKNKGIPSGIGKLTNNHMDEVMSMLKANQQEMINMINSQDFSKTSPNMNFNTINNVNNINNIQENNYKTISKNKTGNIFYNRKYIDDDDTENKSDQIDKLKNMNQLPPMPQFDEKNINNTNIGNSSRFNSQINLDINLLNDLFGIPENTKDPDE